MVEIGGKPILWHILKHYAQHGHNEFFIARLQGRGHQAILPDYSQPRRHDRRHRAEVAVHERDSDAWRVNLIDTGTDRPAAA